jgi:hypothetical protein
MQFKVLAIPPFDRQLKRLVKKYPAFKEDISKLAASLASHPKQGVPIGKECYKIRVALTSKGKGKAGGARVITYLHMARQKVYLLAVYDKSDATNILDSELIDRLKQILPSA